MWVDLPHFGVVPVHVKVGVDVFGAFVESEAVRVFPPHVFGAY